MDKQKALRDGVAPGGLFTKENIRIMMCYLLKVLDSEISQSEFAEILTETELANYFEVSDALVFLEGSTAVTVREENGEAYYTVTEAGKKVADTLCSELPRSAREKAYNAGAAVLARHRMRRCVDTEIRRSGEDSCHLTMTVYDEKKNIMLQTTLYVGDYMQADMIAKRFQTDPTVLYSAVIDALTD